MISSNLLYFLGFLNLLLSGAMATPLVVNWLYQETQQEAFIKAIGVTALTGLATILIFKRSSRDLSHREGFAIVGFGWIQATFFGGLPYIFSGTLPSLVDACFEAASGFTTTGSTVFLDIEKTAHAVLFWRALTQWLGGMGIILLSLAVLPFLGIGGMQLYKAEVPGPTADKLTPKISQTARVLWQVYVLLSVAETVTLYLGGMDLFDSLCHTFTTMATGGFSTKNISIEHYRSPFLEYAITLFMFLAGANFALHYQFLKGNRKAVWQDHEFRAYAGIIAAATFFILLNLHWVLNTSLLDSFRLALFQVVSIQTTTGFSSADFEKWPAFSQLVLLMLMFIGGCAGSTGGALKVIRIVVLFKQAINELYQRVHPHAVRPVKLGGKALSADTLQGIQGLFFLYLLIFAVSSLALCLLGADLVTSISAVATTLGNTGPGLGEVGPLDNFAHLHVISKWILTGCMLIGRLEVYTLLVLLLREFWRK